MSGDPRADGLTKGVPIRGKLTRRITALVNATHHEPRSLLGYHEIPQRRGTPLCVVRVLEPGAETIEVFWEDTPERAASAQAHSRSRPVRRQHSAAPPGGAVPVARALSVRSRGRQTRHLFLLARALGLRPLSIRRRPALRPVPQVRRAPARARRRRRHALRGLGAECQARERGRQLQSLGWPQTRHAGARRIGCLGAVRAGRRRRRGIQVRDPHAARLTAAQVRSFRLLHAEAARRPRPSSPRSKATNGTTPTGCAIARTATGGVRRSTSTRCISPAGSTPGIASRRSTPGRKRPSGSFPTSSTWATRTSSSWAWPSIRSTARGATRWWATTRRPRVTARRRTSWPSSTSATRPASA